MVKILLESEKKCEYLKKRRKTNILICKNLKYHSNSKVYLWNSIK